MWWIQQTFTWYQSLSVKQPWSFLLYGFRIILSSSSFQYSNPYDNYQTFFFQLSSLEKSISPSPWESRHAGLCWWNYGSTTSLWTRNLLNTQPQIFGMESSRSTTSLSPALLSHWGSHGCCCWSLCCTWCLACVRNYV